MAEQDVLAKTNRINSLFDLYCKLLTDKQQLFMRLYFHEDWSLGEIAEHYHITRQAVNEHIKRGKQMLEEYEHKLQLLQQEHQRRLIMRQMEDVITQLEQPYCTKLSELLQRLGGENDGV